MGRGLRSHRKRGGIRGCHTKAVYGSAREALEEQRGCQAYHCDICGGWHLTFHRLEREALQAGGP